MKIIFPDVKYYTINNNFKFIYIKTNSNIFSANITINVGSIDEKGTENELGLAHFFEHMIFKSKKNLNKIDFLGTRYNASTYYNKTNYFISGNNKDYEDIINILLDLFLNPEFPEEDIKNEINVVLEEFKMNQDNKQKETYLKLMEIIYKDIDIKYSIPVIGTIDNIKNFTRTNLINFYKTHYLTANKILSITSSIDQDNILKIISKIFNNNITEWKPEFIKLDSKLEINFLSKSDYKLNIIKSPELKQVIVKIGFRSINLYSKWSIVSELIENILTEGMTSRLFILLRNKLGLTYYQTASSTEFKEHGFFTITYGVQYDGLEISLKNVLEELLYFKPCSQEELQKTKNIYETSLLFNLETSTDIGNYIINFVLNQIDPQYIMSIDKILNKITIDEINNFAKKIFKKTNMFIVINGNDIDYDKIKTIIDKL
jgi:predicted Zn-dependent peptidase